MTENAWQVSAEAAEVYEAKFVPAIFAEWAPRIAGAAGIGPGQRVLDVACGTGIVARECARRGAEVTGLDLNEGMLSVARRISPEIDWRQGDASDVPFEDGSFDAVVCQFGLMFFPEREKSLAEQWRVLAPGGRLAVSTWDAIEQIPIYVAMVGLIERHAGGDAAQALRAPFWLGDTTNLTNVFSAAGIADFEIDTHAGTERFASVDEFVEIEIKGSPLANAFDDDSYAALLADARVELPAYRKGEKDFEFPTSAHIVRAKKP